MKTINIHKFSQAFGAWNNCKKSGNEEWKEKHYETISGYLELLPNGSGIDAGIKFLIDESNPEKLVFGFGFHHMDEHGYYDGWTNHKLILTSSFQFGINYRITGPNRNAVKEYLYDLFHSVFTTQD